MGSIPCRISVGIIVDNVPQYTKSHLPMLARHVRCPEAMNGQGAQSFTYADVDPLIKQLVGMRCLNVALGKGSCDVQLCHMFVESLHC